MENPIAPIAPQPNFDSMSRSLADLSLEISRCGNIPAFQGFDVILDAIRRSQQDTNQRLDEMNRRFDQRFNEMDRRFNEMERRFDRLETRMDVVDRNAQARLFNSQLSSRPHEPLTPLLSLRSIGQPIPRFPDSLNAIDTLTERQVDPLLRHLNEDIRDGDSIDRKRVLLKRAIGVSSFSGTLRA